MSRGSTMLVIDGRSSLDFPKRNCHLARSLLGTSQPTSLPLGTSLSLDLCNETEIRVPLWFRSSARSMNADETPFATPVSIIVAGLAILEITYNSGEHPANPRPRL